MTPPSNGAMVIARPFTEDCYSVQPGHTYNGNTSFSLLLRFSIRAGHIQTGAFFSTPTPTARFPDNMRLAKRWRINPTAP